MDTTTLVWKTMYIGGEWVTPSSSESIDVIEAGTGEAIGSIPAGTKADVDAAVDAARNAQPGWAATAVAERRAALLAIVDALEARGDDIAFLIAREVGTPIAVSRPVQLGLPLTDLRTTAAVVEDLKFEEQVGTSLVLREAVGVVGCITPWNYPLHQIAAKVGPALAAGCTVVVKPSEVAPLNAFVLAEAIQEAGVPPGVFNLVPGTGPIAGEAIATHPDVDMVSFTGSTRAGARVAELAARTVKRVALELGGKSPYVLLPGLEGDELRTAVENGMRKCFFNSGQSCSALTRMLVPWSMKAEVEELAAEIAERYTPGDPLQRDTTLGPVVSEVQRERVLGYIATGIEEGARLLVGDAEPGGTEGNGFFVPATVFTDVRNDMTIAREEIFGPVLAIIPYETADEAVAIANDTSYGLAGGVWGPDPDEARAVASRIQAGQVEVNGGAYNPHAPFGGFKGSGYGRELGRYGLEEYTELKSLQL